MANCGHRYLLYKDKLIGEDELYDFVDVNVIQPVGVELPTYHEIIDRRKNHATHFKFCPLCGDKLDWSRFKRMANAEYKYK